MGRVAEGEWAARAAVVARLRASGVSLAEFSRREGIAYSRLLAWRKRLADGGPGSEVLPAPAAPLFAELVRADAAVSQAAAVEILLPGGAVIRLRRGADASLVRAAIEALKACW